MTAGAYWLAVDLPDARALSRQWPAVDRLAAQFRAEAGPVVAVQADPDFRLMLQLAVDRHIPEIGLSAAPAGARWILRPQDSVALVAHGAHRARGEHQLVRAGTAEDRAAAYTARAAPGAGARRGSPPAASTLR